MFSGYGSGPANKSEQKNLFAMESGYMMTALSCDVDDDDTSTRYAWVEDVEGAWVLLAKHRNIRSFAQCLSPDEAILEVC